MTSRECVFCSKTFSNHEGLLQHLRVHTGEKPYNCKQCFKSFSRDSSLWLHQTCHTNTKNYPCSTCGKKFVSPRYRWAHEKNSHETKRRYMCPFCGEKFASPARLSRHRKRQHPNREKGKLRDILSQYPEEEIIRIPPCYVHLQKLSPAQIRNLKDIHRPASEKKVSTERKTAHRIFMPSCKNPCVFCGATRKSNQDLYHHICSHIGERWYNCKYCSTSFGNATCCWQHERRHKNKILTVNE